MKTFIFICAIIPVLGTAGYLSYHTTKFIYSLGAEGSPGNIMTAGFHGLLILAIGIFLIILMADKLYEKADE